jgi:light-regulated signal transduction histidine kinase (bacteriophytochrome)
MRSSDYEKNEPELEVSDQNIIERQALRFAQEFSGLYKSEKKKREELEALSNELKERNEELMDIVFLTSNQLLDPINKIESNFMLVKGHTDSLLKESAGWFDETQKSLKKLHKLVNEMSKLYKVKSLRSLFRPVSLDKILAEVIEELKATMEKRGRSVHVEPLPVIESDSVQVRILFYQLILLATRDQWVGESSILNIKADRNARGFWRITLAAQGMDFWGCDFGFEECDRRNGLDRSLHLCQRISQRLGGFLYEERVSEKAFSCHVVLPEKKIPLASCLSSQIGDF